MMGLFKLILGVLASGRSELEAWQGNYGAHRAQLEEVKVRRLGDKTQRIATVGPFFRLLRLL